MRAQRTQCVRWSNLNSMHLHIEHKKPNRTEYDYGFVYFFYHFVPVFLHYSELFQRRIENKKSFANESSYLNSDYCIRAQFACNSIGKPFCVCRIWYEICECKMKIAPVSLLLRCIPFHYFFFSYTKWTKK